MAARHYHARKTPLTARNMRRRMYREKFTNALCWNEDNQRGGTKPSADQMQTRACTMAGSKQIPSMVNSCFLVKL